MKKNGINDKYDWDPFHPEKLWKIIFTNYSTTEKDELKRLIEEHANLSVSPKQLVPKSLPPILFRSLVNMQYITRDSETNLMEQLKRYITLSS